MRAAGDYLVARQSADGAWRSNVYGPFKEGDALTAIAVLALIELAGGDAARYEPSIERATGYLAALTQDGAIRPPQHGLAYPVYTAAGAVIALTHSGSEPHLKARDVWLAYLRERQLAEHLGWSPDDAAYGGWGYAADLPRKPGDDLPLGTLAEPNLSATTFALAALRAAGMAADDPAIRKALRYVSRCQNFPAVSSNVGPFDDGGFHFMLGDPVRNKAGAVGVDADGRTRFASYGSATADGVRAFALAGVPADDPRAMAAWQWMRDHFRADAHPGEYAADRAGARESVYFYYVQALSAALIRSNGLAEPVRREWAEQLTRALVARQRTDGSWRNPSVDVREDDPLVASSLAVAALARCGKILECRTTTVAGPPSAR